MSHYIENAVPIAEVAKVTKRPAAEVEAEAVALGLFLGADWAGRPALAERDARELVTGDARRVLEEQVAWSAHLEACRTWETARDAAVRAAHDAVGADPRQGPQKHGQAREAATLAGREFELTHPMPLWQGAECGNARRLYSERPQEGLLKRAAAALTGAGR